MADLSFSDDITVHQLAAQIRTLMRHRMSEAEFSQLLLFMDKLIQGDLERVLAVLRRNPIASNDYQLALCWLDGNGYGGTRFAQLEAGLLQMKGQINQSLPPSLN